jgi:hypothetical protein
MLDELERGMQPLDPQVTGCTLVFVPLGEMYQPLAALAVLAGLHARGFSGVCECYLRPDIDDGKYLMGIALAFAGDCPGAEWWGALADNVQDALDEDGEVRLDRDACDFASLAELRASMRHAGTAGLEDGVAVWVSDPAGPDPDSPFTVLCRSAR